MLASNFAQNASIGPILIKSEQEEVNVVNKEQKILRNPFSSQRRKRSDPVG